MDAMADCAALADFIARVGAVFFIASMSIFLTALACVKTREQSQ